MDGTLTGRLLINLLYLEAGSPEADCLEFVLDQEYK